MNIMHLTPDLIKGVRSTKVLTATQQDHMEVRLFAIFATAQFVNSIWATIAYLQQLAPSTIFKVASLSHAPHVVVWGFIIPLLMMLPHLTALIFFPKKLYVRWPRKLAAAAACIVAVNWAYLAVLAQPIDTQLSLFWIYARQTVEAFYMAFLYAMSLNAQLVRVIHSLLEPEQQYPRRRADDAQTIG